MDTKKISKLISSLRKEKNLSQQALADILGVSSKTISKWECAGGLPDISILKKLSEVFDITVDELLEGNIKDKNNINKKKINKNRLLFIGILITIIILVVTIIIINKNNSIKENNNCTVIRTYYIDNIGKSNDENYLYITVHEFQVEGTFTVKLSKVISKDLEVGNSYEITFKTSRDYLITTTDKLFDKGEIINIEYSDKEGLDRTSKYYCDRENE